MVGRINWLRVRAGRPVAAFLALFVLQCQIVDAQFEQAFDFGTDEGKLNSTASDPPELVGLYEFPEVNEGVVTQVENADSITYTGVMPLGGGGVNGNYGQGYFLENPIALAGVDEANDVFVADITILPGNDLDFFGIALQSVVLSNATKSFQLDNLARLEPGRYTLYTTQTWDNPTSESGAGVGFFDTATIPVDTFQVIPSNWFSRTGEPDVKDLAIELHSFGFVTPGLDGDYNNDGVLDAADYTLWSENFLNTHTLQNDPVGGEIATNQLNVWSSAYGTAAVPSAAVPEPSGLSILVGGLFAGYTRRRR